VAAAGPLPVVVQLEQDAPEIDGTELRDAVARELEVPVVSEEAQGIEAIRIDVRIDHGRRELEVEREGPVGEGIVRRVPLPAGPAETLRMAVFLIGNLARDEAAAVLHDLRPGDATEPVASQGTAPGPVPAPVPIARTAPRSERRRDLWIGGSVEGDAAVMPASNDSCLNYPSLDDLYQCVDGQTAWPPTYSISSQIRKGVDDQVMGGIAPANVRFLVAFDEAVSDHVLLGGRLGFATATYPARDAGALGHLHLEARASYVIGEHPLATAGLSPVLALGAGLAEYSASVPVKVDLVPPSPMPSTAGTVSAWRVAGPGFVSAGVGLRWAVSPGFALSILPLKATFAFGTHAPNFFLSPEITAQFGY
jgi:hypothetical protein